MKIAAKKTDSGYVLTFKDLNQPHINIELTDKQMQQLKAKVLESWWENNKEKKSVNQKQFNPEEDMCNNMQFQQFDTVIQTEEQMIKESANLFKRAIYHYVNGKTVLCDSLPDKRGKEAQTDQSGLTVGSFKYFQQVNNSLGKDQIM